MGELLWKRARAEAREIREKQFVGSAGLKDLKDIARTWGARVHLDDLDDNISGFIIKEKGYLPEIYINASDPPERQRFTLAHEIGHLVDRESLANDPDYSFMDYRDTDGYDLHEFFADEFAGELLMPAVPFVRSYRDEGAFSTARRFGVSVPAVKKRIARLAKNPPEFVR